MIFGKRLLVDKGKTMKAKFTRIAPSKNVEQLALGWFAISHRFIQGKNERRKSHGVIYKIKSKDGSVIYRTLKFSPRLKGSVNTGEGQILLDWQGWINLTDIDTENDAIELKISKANLFGRIYHSMSHPDPIYRHSMKVARIGLYISLISLILSFK